MSLFSLFRPLFLCKTGQWKEAYYLCVAHPIQLKIRKLVEHIGAKANTILDIGGRRSPYTRRLKGQVTSLDKISDTGGYLGLTEQQIEAFEQDEHVKVVLGDARQMPFPDDSFDAILCVEVIEHIREDEQVISEMARVLCPGGRGLITTPNGAVVRNINPYHVRHYMPEEFETKLRKKFNCVQISTIDLWPRFSHFLSVKLRKFQLFNIIIYSIVRPCYFILNFRDPPLTNRNGAVLVASVSSPKK